MPISKAMEVLIWSILDICGIMFKILLVVTFEVQLPLIAALFTVDVLQSNYSAEYGREVTMGCSFRVPSPFTLTEVTVLWKKNKKDIYKLHKNEEDLSQQDIDYQGRATVVREELTKGRSMLRISDLRLTDAGSYICIVDYQGAADYKYITLEVEAPYKTINLQVRREAKGVVLTCHSEGFPQAEVSWHNETDSNISTLAKTTYDLTSDGIFNITSVLKVKPSIRGNYSCVFWNKKLNQKTSAQVSVHLQDQMDSLSPISIILPICFLGLFFLILLLVLSRRKQFTNLCSPKGRRKGCYPLKTVNRISSIRPTNTSPPQTSSPGTTEAKLRLTAEGEETEMEKVKEPGRESC